jgi:hypothetical protein
MRRHLPFISLFAVIAVIAGLPSVANATDRYYWGSPGNDQSWPSCSSTTGCNTAKDGSYFNLSETSARTVNGNSVCTFSADYPGLGTTAVVCSASLAVKPLCGCQPRYGISRGTFDNPVPLGRAQVVY